MKIKRSWIEYIGFALPLVLALMCVLTVTMGSQQAALPVPMPQEFLGEYSYDGENWLPLNDQAELSALEGDLYLRGHLLRPMQEGWRLDFYRNHIGVSIAVNGTTIFMDTVIQMDQMGRPLSPSMCGRTWTGFTCPAISGEDLVEIRLHNPHSYGNESAYRDFLTTLCSDTPELNLLEKQLEHKSEHFRVIGGLLAIAALMLLGAAIAAVAVRIPVGGILLKLGLTTLFMGGFIFYDTIDISFRSELTVQNTYTVQLCMMLGVLCFGHYVSAEAVSGKRQTAAKLAVGLSAVVDSVLILLSFVGGVAIYDTLAVWSISQLILCSVLIGCCVPELRVRREHRLAPVSALVLLGAILLDLAGVGSGIIWRSPCAKVVFLILFVVHFVTAAAGVVKNHRAAIRADKLEKELEDSRIAIMLSQIKPHFLYNVLNAIYHLYRKEPETAQEAVSSFADYLRCNMLSIEKREPIPFTEEYRHIQTYLSLEQIRYRGRLQVVYDVEVMEFKLPPLTVEPLVENAVKHGVTKKRGGGTVTISTRKCADRYEITVADTGVGFAPDSYMEDGKPHVGIRNVQQRLHSMVGGTLSITSSPEGTVARVTIPAKDGNGIK